ncbi:helix-turn-helix domain-containing protein [Flavobacterium hiemivividum]|uniref:XRE family transcriptional regulator n=1 Tax=Flavobacterium hiemivividum TaxID=2541734 RepID=A0A4R5CYD2_9FLAO|nr:helix-turn-helix transcriptional regulator [Flavobacterium hiemivividum]TDE05636.1 XRE family transcriptional regulator [Flavobacterium hiemivividum]
MVNIEDFIKRLEIILDYYGLNASAFADKIGVQRSSLSHLLSGRNKPSLDFILKILDVFPDVDLYWILNGKGSFPKNNDPIRKQENNLEPVERTIPTVPTPEVTATRDLFSEEKNKGDKNSFASKSEEIQNAVNSSISADVEKIVFFYRDGTFKVFTPN